MNVLVFEMLRQVALPAPGFVGEMDFDCWSCKGLKSAFRDSIFGGSLIDFCTARFWKRFFASSGEKPKASCRNLLTSVKSSSKLIFSSCSYNFAMTCLSDSYTLAQK